MYVYCSPNGFLSDGSSAFGVQRCLLLGAIELFVLVFLSAD